MKKLVLLATILLLLAFKYCKKKPDDIILFPGAYMNSTTTPYGKVVVGYNHDPRYPDYLFIEVINSKNKVTDISLKYKGGAVSLESVYTYREQRGFTSTFVMTKKQFNCLFAYEVNEMYFYTPFVKCRKKYIRTTINPNTFKFANLKNQEIKIRGDPN